MWQDNISKNDMLGFDLHARIIIALLQEQKMLPLTLGVFGDWGSGKSSILEKIYEELKTKSFQDKGIFTIQFNGWTFEGYDDAKAALMEAIVKKIEDEFKTIEEVKSVAKRLYKSINWMRVAKVTVPMATAYFTGGASIIPQIISNLKEFKDAPQKIIDLLCSDKAEDKIKGFIKENPDTPSQESQSIREFRKDMTELLAKSNIKELVVIIDDLDRCLPERIIDNLEAIKLFLNVDNTAFIIGADPRIVESAITHRYKDKFPLNPSMSDGEDAMDKKIVRDYLEKLIQVPYNLPKLSDTEVNTYITLLFCENAFSHEEFESVYLDFLNFKEKKRYSAYDIKIIKSRLGEEIIKKLDDDCLLICQLSGLIATCLKGNPRQIKRFLNMYMLRKKIKDAAQMKDINETVLAKLMILEYKSPSLFGEIYQDLNPKTGKSSKIKKYEKAETKDLPQNWKDESTIQWLQSSPKLAEFNLLDYFWLSRDKLSSLSSLYMTDPEIRSLFIELSAPELPEPVIKKIVDEKLRILDKEKQLSFYTLLSNKIIEDPSKRGLYHLFEYTIDLETCKSSYQTTISTCGSKVPPAAKKAYERLLNPKK